jgi:putative oxidoreductase
MEQQLAAGKKVVAIAGRALLGLYFVIPGITKITGFSGTSEYMAAHGVPFVPVLLVLTIILQVGGGAALLAGYRTQIVAFVLAGLTLVISLFMHDFWNFAEGLERAHETQNFIKNMAIMAGLMFVAGGKLDSKP